jgi:hypothetical protein
MDHLYNQLVLMLVSQRLKADLVLFFVPIKEDSPKKLSMVGWIRGQKSEL